MNGIIANKQVQVIILIAALMGVAFYTGVFPTGQFGTGLDLNTDTVSMEGLDDWHGNHEDSEFPELIMFPQIEKLVTAWYKDPGDGAGDDSVALTMYGEISVEYPPRIGWDAKDGWYRVTVADESTNGEFSKIILETGDGANSYTNKDYIGSTSGAIGRQVLYEHKTGSFFGLFPDGVSKTLHPVTFTLSGPHIGGIRVEQITVFTRLLWPDSEPIVTSSDEVYLVSGEGSIEFSSEATNYAPGDVVTVEVDTGHSGMSQEGAANERWKVVFYNSQSVSEYEEMIADNLNGFKVNFAIPIDAQTGKCEVKLYNPLFVQDSSIFYTLSKEDIAKVPTLKSITFDKTKYRLGDTVKVTFEGTPNPLGTNTISGFEIWAKHGTTGTDMVSGWDDTYVVVGESNKQTIEVKPAKGNLYLEIKACAFDGATTTNLPYGLPSNIIAKTVYIEDDTPENLDIMWIIAIIIIIIAIAIIAILPLPNQYKIILGMLVTVVILVYMWFTYLY